MKKQGRYSTSGLVEDQYMPGSNGKVLRNLLDITTQEEIDRVETEQLFEITDQLLDEFDKNRRFSTDDLLQIHRRWLGSLYEWAGTYRQVMMSKGDFMFAAPAYIPKLMADFEKERQKEYFAAVQYGLDRNYKPMKKVFTDVIARSFQAYEE